MQTLARVAQAVLLLAMWHPTAMLIAQVPTSGKSKSADPTRNVVRTEVEFELLTGRTGVGLSAQEWGRIFRQIGLPLRVRRAILDERPDLKERMLGRTRYVLVIGKLEADGRIVFPGKSFTPNDTARLVEWVNELKTYGAQGSPKGQPVFGLNKQQFSQVFNSLIPPQPDALQGLSFSESLQRFHFQKQIPIRFSTSASEWLRLHPPEPIRQSLAGLSQGTAFAILLKNRGLGFRPTRTPTGEIEFVVDPIEAGFDRWPIGWELRQTRLKTAPKLFKMLPVDLDQVPLRDVLEVASIKSEVPILIDYYRIEAKGIDLSKLKVSVLPKRTSWMQLLRTITNPHKLTRKLLIDEQGRPFVWVTVLDPKGKD